MVVSTKTLATPAKIHNDGLPDLGSPALSPDFTNQADETLHCRTVKLAQIIGWQYCVVSQASVLR